MRNIIYLIICIFPLTIFAQPSPLLWDKTYGDNGDDGFEQIIEATNGYLVGVGETNAGTAGSKDGLLVMIDFSTGQQIVKKNLGGKKDDGFYAVAQTFDGHFLLAGYTKSSGLGKSDAWLVKVDKQGNTVWEATFGSPGDDAIEHLLLNPNGNAIAAGTFHDQKRGDIWLAEIEEQKLLWETFIGQGQYASVKGMTLAQDGGMALVGNTAQSSNRKKGDIWLAKTTNKGQYQWEKYFGERDWEEASDIITTADGGFAICGLTNSKGAGDNDMWLIKTNGAGFMEWEQTFGGKDSDIANAIATTPDQGFLLMGLTKSHRSGARQPRAMVLKANAGGGREWTFDHGGNKDDEATVALSLHDGSYILGGKTESQGSSGKNSWMSRWDNPTPFFGGSKQAAPEFSQIVLNTADGQLKPGDKAYLSFDISNTSNVDLADVQVRVIQQSGVDGIEVWNNNYLGYLQKAAARNIKIPVSASEALSSGESTFGVSIVSGNEPLTNLNFTIASKKPEAAAVEFGTYNFVESTVSDDETLTVIVRNPGDYTASAVSVRFELPPGLQAVGSINQSLGNIGPHGSKSVKLTYRRTATLRDGRVAISCIVKLGQTEIRKTLERGGSFGDDVVLIITEPSESATNIQNIVSDKNVFDIKVGASATNPLRQQDFKVYNNSMVIDGSKMDEVDLKKASQSSGRFNYVYGTRVHLSPGENKVQVEVLTPTGATRTKTMVVYYEPHQPNLHVLAIGPSHNDLKFTSKDAEDFARAFENQGNSNKLFGKVFVRKLITPEETQSINIREAIADLVYQYQNAAAAQRILSNDVLLVFVSSHGKNNPEGFKLLPSDYESRYERTRTIDYQRDIVNELEKINCKKLVFLDACHSGAADSKSLSDVARADALSKLAAMHPGMSTLTSCRANEMSYEDQNWQNGAFTEAIMEAFANTPILDSGGTFKADADSNNIITLSELYDFLRRRVPGMVKSQKPNAPTLQTPFMPENQLIKEDVSIYVVE